jgi:hypothetical protein
MINYQQYWCEFEKIDIFGRVGEWLFFIAQSGGGGSGAASQEGGI